MTKPLMVAVAGGSGSGKSTVVEKIKKILELKGVKVIVLHQDHYYRDLSHLTHEQKNQVNFDHPDSIETELLFEHFKILSKGSSISRPTYDFVTHTRQKELSVQIEPSEVILFDGIFSLHYEEIQPLFNLKFFVEVDDDIRFIRRLKRDRKERGRTTEHVISQYFKDVRPMHRKYVGPSIANSDVVINWEKYDDQLIESLCNKIQEKLST